MVQATKAAPSRNDDTESRKAALLHRSSLCILLYIRDRAPGKPNGRSAQQTELCQQPHGSVLLISLLIDVRARIAQQACPRRRLRCCASRSVLLH